MTQILQIIVDGIDRSGFDLKVMTKNRGFEFGSGLTI